MAKDDASNSTGHQMPLFEFDDDNLKRLKHHPANGSSEESDFGKYIMYVDESGDHSLQSIDQSYRYLLWHFVFFTSAITVKPLFQ